MFGSFLSVDHLCRTSRTSRTQRLFWDLAVASKSAGCTHTMRLSCVAFESPGLLSEDVAGVRKQFDHDQQSQLDALRVSERRAWQCL